jgi:hypothetical protein
VNEIASRFDSNVVRDPRGHLINIVPPIKKDKLDEFGKALVQLDHDLNPDDPNPATYNIK